LCSTRRIDFFQAAQLALGLLADVLGKVRLGQLLTQIFGLGLVRVLLAQFLFDGALLLPQQVFALILRHLRARVFGDLVAQLGDVHLVRQPPHYQP